MNIKKLKIIFILLVLLLVWLTWINLFYNFNYINQEDKSLIGLPEKSIALFMRKRPFNKQYTVYYLDGINIYGLEQLMSPQSSTGASFYYSNCNNNLDKYLWIFELLLLIGIIVFSRYIKKLENNKTDYQKIP